MKSALLMTMALVLFAIPAAGQDPDAGYLGLFADEEGLVCAVNDTPGLITVYVVHMDSPGTTGSRFAIDYDGAPALQFIAESVIGIPLGNTHDGLSIGYGDCLVSPFVAVTISFLGEGLSEPCSTLRIIPDPTLGDLGEIQSTDCSTIPVLLNAEGRGMFINPTEDCPDCGGVPVATEIDTWGNLKSLYR